MNPPAPPLGSVVWEGAEDSLGEPDAWPAAGENGVDVSEAELIMELSDVTTARKV